MKTVVSRVTGAVHHLSFTEGMDPNVERTEPSKDTSSEVRSAISPNFTVNVVRTLEEESSPTSIDFHPASDAVLLVGTDDGTVLIWDVKAGVKLYFHHFVVWDLLVCCTTVQDLENDKKLRVSVNKVLWCDPSGSYFGVAFSQHLVHLYRRGSGGIVSVNKEIDAHDGSVNDLAFSRQKPHSSVILMLITCGDDRKIHVWNADTTALLYTFDGHSAPVCSICPYLKNEVHLLLSTSIDGKMKTWLYHKRGGGGNIDCPGVGDCKLNYNAANNRLFLCGITKDRESYFVEWDEVKRCIKRSYKGLKNPCSSTIKFNSSPNQILAAGDEHMVKFWSMDNVELLTSTDADGGLPECPSICFNRRSTLLAVCAKENKIKILEISNENLGKHECIKRSDSNEMWPNYWNVSEICEPSQCQSLQLPVHTKHMIDRLTYNHAGNCIFALALNGSLVRWMWPCGHTNLDGKANTKVSPKSFHPILRNDLKKHNRKDQASCLAVSKDDQYILSSSGAAINLFDLYLSRMMGNFKRNAPMSTCIAFHPHIDGVAALGMEDCSICIYNCFIIEDIKKLVDGHTKRVTALAFSKEYTILVSGDADARICVWDTTDWTLYKVISLESQQRVESETCIQFNKEWTHFFVAHNTHLAIYEAKKLRWVKQRVLEDPISRAVFSCDGHMIYTLLENGNIAMYNASDLEIHCKINFATFVSKDPSLTIKPVSIAAHPNKPYQFALGFTNGTVQVFEP
ncbi:hypothetical protein S83_010669 [Arachis hypogaea]